MRHNIKTSYRLAAIIAEFKSSVRLAIPLVATEVLYGITNFIATVMVAHLGKEQLAANALAWSIYLAVILFFIGIFCSIEIMSSQSFGAKDNVSVGICFKQGLIMAIIFALPMSLMMLGIPTLLVWINQDPVVIAHAKPLFYSLVWSMLPLNLVVVIQQFLTSIAKARLVMFMSMLALPLEIFLYYAFLFGKFGFPNMGLAGFGYSLAISYSLISGFFGGYLYFARQFKVFSLFKKWWVIEYKFFREMLRVGLPLGLMLCSELIFFAIVAIMMGALGVTVLAAYQIAYQYLMVGLVVLFGLSQTALVRVGNEVGCNNRQQLSLAAMVNMGMALTLILIFSLFYFTFPHIAVSLDINVEVDNFKGVATEAIKFLPIVGVLLITECVRLISCSALRGLKDSSFQLLISILGFWLIAFPCAYLLAFKLCWGGVGIWWGIVIGSVVTGLALLARFQRLVKRVNLLSLITQK